MKILHVVTIYFQIPYFVGNQLSYFKNKGNDMFIVCSPSDEVEEASKNQGFSYNEIPITRTISPLKDLKSLFSIYNYIRKNNIDVVTGHSPKGSLLGLAASFMASVPQRIYLRHGLVFETSTGLKRFILKNMDRLTAFFATDIVCVSPSIYNKSLEYKLNPEKKQLILSKGTCNGIDLNKFNKSKFNENMLSEKRAKLKIPNGNKVIGFVGRLVKDKGIIELVEAFESLQSKYKDINLLLVGMFEERDALPEKIKSKIQNNPSIIYTGYVPSNLMPEYYAIMDIFVLPSYREGFPTSVLEASAMELPVVTTRVTGGIDSIIEFETGLFADNTSENLKEVIETLLLDEKKRISYGKNGYKFVRDNFDQEKIWAELEKLYISENRKK